MAPPDLLPQGPPEEVPPVTLIELRAAVLRLQAKKTAPGPDGVPGRALVLALKHLGSRLLTLFDSCLESGRFPKTWKDGRLCLLRKEGRSPDSPSGYRPIILLDEVGKLLERIVASRIDQHLRSEGPNLAEEQFGFRCGRSTVDALLRLKSISKEAIARGERVLAVSLDIANAFNSLPYGCIEEALRYHRVPLYLRRLVEHYLRDRDVLYLDESGRVCARRMTTGVPQGSVMGPLLWNIGYNWVLRGALLPRTHIICYADDTLFIARGSSYKEVAHLATVGSTLLVGRINLLGLKVALNKTEVISFHGRRGAPPAGAYIRVDGVRVLVRSHLKYLGLTLDSAWNFEEHFRLLCPKLQGVAGSLARLLPNLGGPNVLCRRLFAGVIKSMALYGSPVWADALTAKNKALLRRPQRIMAIRSIRGYRTVSYGAACAIAGSPPWHKEAVVLAEIYQHKKDCQDHLAPQEVRQARKESYETAIRGWAQELDSAQFGRRTIDAIRPVLDEWVHRKHGVLTYRLVQILSGHGCFGHYLNRVAKREINTTCQHCGDPDDTAQHTLEVCNAWASQRQLLVAAVGQDLSLPSVITSMLDSNSSWEAMVSFCEEVISEKEAAERVREVDPLAHPCRRRKAGRRRRNFLRLLPLDGNQQDSGAGSPDPALHRSPMSADVLNVPGHPPSPQVGRRRGVRVTRTVTDRVAVEFIRDPVTLSSSNAASNFSSEDERFDDALALR